MLPIEYKIPACKRNVTEKLCFPSILAEVPKRLIEAHVSPESARRYLKFDVDAFVESNKSIRWCPAAGCQRAVSLPPQSLLHAAAHAQVCVTLGDFPCILVINIISPNLLSMTGFSLCGLRCRPFLLLGVQQRGARARHLRPVEAVARALPESGP